MDVLRRHQIFSLLRIVYFYFILKSSKVLFMLPSTLKIGFHYTKRFYNFSPLFPYTSFKTILLRPRNYDKVNSNALYYIISCFVYTTLCGYYLQKYYTSIDTIKLFTKGGNGIFTDEWKVYSEIYE